MVFLFRDRSDINLLFLVLLSVAVHFHFYWEAPFVIADPTDGLLAYLLFHYIKPLPPLALYTKSRRKTMQAVLYYLQIARRTLALGNTLSNLFATARTLYAGSTLICFADLISQRNCASCLIKSDLFLSVPRR